MQNQKRKILSGRETPLFIFLTAIVIVLDQITKSIVRNKLPEGTVIPIIDGYLRFKGVRNPGGAFGLLPESKILLVIITAFVILFVMIYYLINKPEKKSIIIALSLIVGGAIGNLIDRIAFDKVTDFIDLRFWPVFNLADVAIVMGVIVFIVIIFKNESAKNVEP